MALGLQYIHDYNQIKERFNSLTPQHYLSVLNQKGSGNLPYYEGEYDPEQQLGQGIFTDFLRDRAFPMLLKVGPHFIKGVSKVIKDIERGKNVGESVKKRGIRSLKRAASTILTGKGKAKKMQKSAPKKLNRNPKVIKKVKNKDNKKRKSLKKISFFD